MSARNGDKSRFNRERKQKIARRTRAQALLGRTTPKSTLAETAGRRAKPRRVAP